jgi:site-specific DNA recombinase
LHPDGNSQRIEIRGELAAILTLAKDASGQRDASEHPSVVAEQIKLVAGTGFEPVTFRL